MAARVFAEKVGGGEVSPSKFDANTSYHIDFPAHAVAARTFAEKGACRSTAVKRNHDCTHCATKSHPPRSFSLTVGGGEVVSQPFDATSSYRQDYLPHAVGPRVFAPKVGGGAIDGGQPFTHTTESQNEYAAPLDKCARGVRALKY